MCVGYVCIHVHVHCNFIVNFHVTQKLESLPKLVTAESLAEKQKAVEERKKQVSVCDYTQIIALNIANMFGESVALLVWLFRIYYRS